MQLFYIFRAYHFHNESLMFCRICEHHQNTSCFDLVSPLGVYIFSRKLSVIYTESIRQAVGIKSISATMTTSLYDLLIGTLRASSIRCGRSSVFRRDVFIYRSDTVSFQAQFVTIVSLQILPYLREEFKD
jgi:hypothetical protein